jgi:DNA gyrase/topoisomerase IV subunit A
MNFEADMIDVTRANIEQYARATFERALAFLFDGLKPVGRRILYTMWEDKIYDHHKVAGIAGVTMSRYHPHGDKAISDALIKLAQPFNMNHPLVDGQGNFGTQAGDPAASPRYIEAKLSDFARDVLTDDIDDHSIDYVDNYDYRMKEPVYLPAKIPLLLVEGSYGIAEAFTASIPPHNLAEVVDICVRFIANKDIALDELVDGFYPDFPTGGEILNGLDIKACYTKGVPCSIKIRSKVTVDNHNSLITINELPYGVSFDLIKRTVVESRVKDRELSPFWNVIQLQPNNQKPGRPYEIDCKKEANLGEILFALFTQTQLESSRTLSLIVNVGEKPALVTIKDIVREWYNARCATKRRKMVYEISTLQNKTHVLEGIAKSHEKIDDIIQTIRKSTDRQTTIEAMVKKFDLTPIQARGIYDMSLGSLSRYSKDDLTNTITKNKARIEELTHDLTRIDSIIVKELLEIKEKYHRPRRTTVLENSQSKSKRENNASGNMSIGNGMVLWSGDQVGLFDQDFLLHGKKINQGLGRSAIVDGSNPTTSEMKALVVFHKNGTAKRVELTTFRLPNAWQKIGDSPIVSVIPVYDVDTETIVCLSEDYLIRQFNPNEISTRSVQVGKIISAAYTKGQKDMILVMDNVMNYLYLPKEEIPVLSRTANGVKTSIDDKAKGVFVSVMNSQSPSAIVVIRMGDNDMSQGYVHFVNPATLIAGKRTNKTKSLVEDAGYMRALGASTIVAKDLKTELILIGQTELTSVPMKHVRATGAPRRVPMIPTGSIVYEL